MLTSLRTDHRLRLVTCISLSATLAGFAIVVGMAYAKGLDPISLTGDSKGYILLAQNLLEHHVFSLSEPPYAPESFRAPGYPVFLAGLFALFGVSLTALFVHAIIMSLAPILLYLLAWQHHERAAFWGAVLFAFEPVRLFVSASFLSDASFTVLFLASLFALEKGRESVSWRWIGASGLLLGVMILVRPIAMFLPPVYAAYMLIRIRPFSAAVMRSAVVVGLSFMVISPWAYRNHVVFDSWNVSSVGTANLVLYNAPEFLKWKPDPRAQAILDAFNAEQATLPRAEALSLARSEVFTSTFREIIRGHEISYIFFHGMKTIPFFVTDGLRDTIRLLQVDIGTMPNISTALMRADVSTLFSYMRSGGLPIALLLIGSGFWTAATLLASLEGVRALRRLFVPTLFLVALIAYFALLTGPVSNARYRLPIEGLLIFLALLPLCRWYDARHGKA